jgi:hypothetical protein
MFFDSALGKFSLNDHVSASTPVIECDTDWYKVDQCIVNWIYTTCSPEVLQIVRQRTTDAFTLWTLINNLYHDNKLQRAVFCEAEFPNLYQGDMTISDYCAKLKTIIDNLHDVGQPVSESSQVLNMLRGLNQKYRHAISAITSSQPPHTFLNSCSHLLMEELFDNQCAAAVANHALFAGHGNSSQPPAQSGQTSSNSADESSGQGSQGKNSKKKKKKKKGWGTDG